MKEGTTFYNTMKVVVPFISFVIAIFGTEKWVIAYGFYIVIFGLIVISEQLERLLENVKGG